MLRELSIRKILYIDCLDLEFSSGLNVLTGETGAGKSILLDALGFATGRRAGKGLLQAGADSGEVSACFAISGDHPAGRILGSQEITVEDELILRRTIASSGRSAAFANGVRITAEVLRTIGQMLIDIHGSHEDRGLMDPTEHVRLLDAFAGNEEILKSVGILWRKVENLNARRNRIQKEIAEMDREAEYDRHVAAELQSLDLREGEVNELQESRSRLKSAMKAWTKVENVNRVVGMEGSVGLLLEGLRGLEQIEDGLSVQLENAVNAIARALNELEEAQMQIDEFLGERDIAPGELERIEDRLYLIRSLARKHGVLAEELPGLQEKYLRKEQRSGDLACELNRTEMEIQSIRQHYDEAADRLSESRHSAAGRLDSLIARELDALRLAGARFATRIVERQDSSTGRERVSFTVATVTDNEPGPINMIASGGEMARFTLAIKVCLAGTMAGFCMIFDEIDRGVGGATAAAIGTRLVRLARQNQSIVVTHSPQVAAHGDLHLRVSRTESDCGTGIVVDHLARDDRVCELARMLSGKSITTQAKEAAGKLLEDSRT